jgi:O-antigen/teichoic acid export membrane protein
LSFAMVVPLTTCLALLARPVVLAWVGPNFAGSIPVIHILSIAVALRVGNATSTTLLKGSGQHQLLAISNIAMALSNLALSVLLVQRYGLVGVAAGTLIPMIVISSLVLFPAACRRVNMSPLDVVREALWPATWPAIIMTAFLLIAKRVTSPSWPLIFMQASIAAIIYVGLFVRFAISEAERKWYLEKARELLKPSRSPVESETEVSRQI